MKSHSLQSTDPFASLPMTFRLPISDVITAPSMDEVRAQQRALVSSALQRGLAVDQSTDPENGDVLYRISATSH